jgi:hypothetical protein
MALIPFLENAFALRLFFRGRRTSWRVLLVHRVNGDEGAVQEFNDFVI